LLEWRETFPGHGAEKHESASGDFTHGRDEEPAEHAAERGRGKHQAVAPRADVQRLGGQQDQGGLAHLTREVAHAKQDRDNAEQVVAGQVRFLVVRGGRCLRRAGQLGRQRG